MDLRKLTEEYYAANKHMQLATSADSQPWICTVYYAYDDELNIFWTSGRSRQHSLEIKNNPRVAITIVRDTERKQALQIVGTAQEVDDSNLEKVHRIYTDRYGPMPDYLEDIRQHTPEGRAYWVFRPTTISIWDEVNFPDSPKQACLLS